MNIPRPFDQKVIWVEEEDIADIIINILKKAGALIVYDPDTWEGGKIDYALVRHDLSRLAVLGYTQTQNTMMWDYFTESIRTGILRPEKKYFFKT